MKKVGILTINGEENFGNRLQNYAVQETLKKYADEVETIFNEKDLYGRPYYKMQLKNTIKKLCFFHIKGRRYKNFAKFSKNIKYGKDRINQENATEIGKKYSCFFTGSDQVWNPTFSRTSDIDFITFADKEKRNSFSASIATKEIPEEQKAVFAKRLKGMNHISVREDRGREIVEELTGRKDAVVLLDPTMLLAKEEWRKVSKRPKKLKKEKYILNYFLGEVSEERKKAIEKIAKENDCEIINILDEREPLYESGPSEFLYLEEHAFLVCTDSFHSCVFAILFNRPFIVFDREEKNVANMNTRIETLLNKFQLEDRKFSGKIKKENLMIDYTDTYQILEKEREKAEKFIKNALEI